MPHATLKLQPGVNQNRTITLNEAAISNTQLVRFVPDQQGLGLVQKLGGWTKFFSNSIGSIIRALLAWEDTNAISHLAVGCQTRISTIISVVGNGSSVTVTYSGSNVYNVGDIIAITGVTPSAYNGVYTVSSSINPVSQSNPIPASSPGSITFSSTVTSAYVSGGQISSGDGLNVITNGSKSIITPRSESSSVPLPAYYPASIQGVQTTSGSSLVTINATASNISSYDTVNIQTQISVGGLILFGAYPTTLLDANSFQINAVDALGNPQNATSTVAAPGGGNLPVFTFVSGNSIVTVNLPNHGYAVGDTFPVIISLTSSGVTLYGNYIIVSINDANNFQIIANATASSNATATLNNGDAQYIYYKTPGALPLGLTYGQSIYGIGLYGIGDVPTLDTGGYPITAVDWTLDNWGEILISCPIGGPIFQWGPTTGVTRAAIIPQAPVANDGMFVAMPQRQIVAWGSTFTGIQDPLLLRWCDVEDYNSWIATVTNQAGSYRIPKGSKIVGCIQGPQQGLVWTDLGIWAMQYAGPPYVYQFNELGNGCGLVGRKAATSLNNVVYWMGQSQFFQLGANGVQPILCPVWDVIFQDIDLSNADKIRVAPNSYFGEVAWYYPTITSNGEIAKYVKYNTVLNQWDFGSLVRTAWINQSVLGPPIGAAIVGNNNYIYQHETSTDADGAPLVSSFQTGYFAISEGEFKTFVDQIWPDMKWGYYDGSQNASLNLTFYVTDYPTSDPKIYGPYIINSTKNYVTPRFRGRLVSFNMQSNDIGSFWRIGATRYRFQQDGKF